MIRVENVHKSYDGQKILDGISFHIRSGSVTTIIGGSGAGKSVLIRLLIGLEEPDSGAILFDGKNIVGMKTVELNKIRRRFGVLFQDAALFDSLTVKENVAFPVREHLRLGEKEIDKIVQQKLSEVGMSGHEDKFPAELSGGMRKRIGLARALALEPDIVFFDEPTTGLDPIMQAVIFRLIISTHTVRPSTYVLVSHDIQGVLNISDEIMLLYEGKIAAKGTPQEISSSSDPLVYQFITGSPTGPIVVE
ncbi:MAG: ABC transporter ATP-binding protein [Desulfomonilaceae bacterium]